MKNEYKERALENINNINKRVTILLEIVDRKRASNDKEMIQMLNEIHRLTEQTSNLIDVS